MSFWAYILRCADGSYYTGHAEDIERRLAEHQSGALPGYTHDRRPVELVWSESFPTREQALAAERRIEPWSRAKKEALIASDWAALGHAAIPPRERAARALASAAPRLRSGQTEEGSAIVPFAAPPEQSVPPAHRPPSTYHPVRPERSRGSVPREADAARNPEILPPAIILVRPQLGENIGKAARAMLNFGLTDLRLVAPRDGWPNPSAGPAASGADIVLERAQIFDDVAAASADCTHVYATTVRRRGLVKPVVTPAEAAARIRTEPGRAAILFGPERTGLETDDVAAARTILTVPINPEFGSLNLAQAVILVAYEWSKGESLASPPAIDLDPPAPQAELEGLVEHLQGLLDKAGYFFPPDRAPATRRTLRSVLTKASWNAQEVRTLRGVLSALEKPRQR